MRRLLFLLTCLVFFVSGTMAQSKKITGKIIDEKGNPVPNASVVVKGTKIGTSTLVDGTFELSVPGSAKVLTVSSISFAAQDVSIANNSSITLTLLSASQSLDEVVVTGYGTQKRTDITGNITTVKGSSVANKPIQSFVQDLGGKVAGVQITIPNGITNAPPVFRIRGTNSISLSSYPLIVVDGVVTYVGDYSSTNAPSNPLASINPDDIESIDVAKDAAATAIYGSRAANGVVYVTTKKGKSGKSKLVYNGNISFTQAQRLPQLMDAQTYTDTKNEALANRPALNSNNPNGSNYYHFALTNGADGKPINTNWYNYIYRTGVSHNHNLNLTGGNDNTSYYFSVGYSDQNGIIKRNEFKRINALFNIDSKINNIVTIGGKISIANEQNLAASSTGSLSGEAFNTGGLGRIAVVLPSNISPYLNDGTYNLSGNAIGVMNNTTNIGVSYYNPVVILDKDRSNNETNQIQSNAYVQIKPVKWLSYKSLFGIDYLLLDNDLFQNPLQGDGYTYNGYATATYDKYKRWVWDNTLSANFNIQDNHHIDVLIGTEQERVTKWGYGINRQSVADPVYNLIQAPGYTTNNAQNNLFGGNFLVSEFGRVNYDFKKKYFLSANLRQDEYSALGNKKGIFYGFSAAWDISNESFWKKSISKSVVNSLKIRASYGKVGNASVGDYDAYYLYSSGLYGGTPTLYYYSSGNPDLKWETSQKTDISIMFSLLKNRIYGEISYYNNNISNLILYVPQAPSTGLPNSGSVGSPGTVPLNVGTMYNKGVEIALGATPIKTTDFTWNTNFNITFNKNLVTALATGLTEISTSTSSLETVSKTKPGYSLGYLFVARTAGVDAQTGRRIFINKSGQQVYYQYYAPSGQYLWSYADGTQASAVSQAGDGVYYKNTQPKFYGGWTNDFTYKNFDLNFTFSFQGGNYVYYGTNAGLHDQRFWNNQTDIANRWKKAGDNAKYPKIVFGDNISNGSSFPLDINVFKGDFIKLRSITFGYNLPTDLVHKAKISGVRFYVSALTPFIITKYPGPDPEVSSNGTANTAQGVDRNTAANARTFLLGLSVSF